MVDVPHPPSGGHTYRVTPSPSRSGQRPGLSQLGATRDYPRAWQTAENAAGAVATIFWAHFVPYGLGHDFTHVEFVADRLLDAGRPKAAMTLLVTYTGEASGADSERAAQLAARAINELAESSEGVVGGALLEYELQKLFDLMDRHRAAVGDDTIAELEWQYLPALGFEPTATGLHRRMAADAQFFVELVSIVYRPMNQAADDGDGAMEPPDAQTRQQVHRAQRLLKSWQHPPGLRDDGTIDPTTLRNWITEARRLLHDADRTEVGEQCIGQVLWSAPGGTDGIKPGPAVRELLEEFCSEHIETGLRRGRCVSQRSLKLQRSLRVGIWAVKRISEIAKRIWCGRAMACSPATAFAEVRGGTGQASDALGRSGWPVPVAGRGAPRWR